MMTVGKACLCFAVSLFCAVTGWAGVVHYVVPPMSETPYLPTALPADGEKDGIVRIVAAKGEYEPGSFILRSDADLKDVRLELGALTNEKGDVFPPQNLDLKVVKVWYQNRNGWFSYFGDCGWKLVPELLLNDENLIEVDEKSERNYARIVREDGTTFSKWLNPPRQVDVGFQSMRKGFSDAKTLQPVRLEKDRSKQFFLTAHVTSDVPAGLYVGKVEIRGGGGQWRVPVSLRVLDFELPEDPCTYADPEREMYVSAYDTTGFKSIAAINGGDMELAKRQFVAICSNYVAHGQTLLKNLARSEDETRATFDVMREAGMREDVFNGSVRVLRFKDPENHVEELRTHAKKLAKMLDETIGHHNVFIAFGDEPGDTWLVTNRPVFEAYQAEGSKFFLAGGDNVFNKVGWCYDWHNVAKSPEDDSSARLWAQLPTHPSVAWYAYQHTGTENPAFNRRQYGLAPYLSGYTAICNLGQDIGSTTYNDDTVTYRPLLINYRSYDGVLDTLEWEGFREGIDDIRYATLLVRLARKTAALGTAEAKVAANKAAMVLARADRARDDLSMLRAEMIRQIGILSRYVSPASALTRRPQVNAVSRPVAKLPTYKFKKDVFTNLNLVNPEPTNVAHAVRKEYVVRYSTRPISGLGDWDRLTTKPEVQVFDRKYKGGSLDFLTTDVSTGDRGTFAKDGKELRLSTLQVAADEWGLHFRFETFSDKAREVAMGIGGMGSFECYLAPGPDAPYECFLTAVSSQPKPHVWHTQYDHAGYRRSDAKDRNSYRQEVAFTDTSAVVYGAFSWEQFYYAVPKDGDIWDFESINWGPMKSAWNGAESIHGRSTWGKIRFALDESARLRILRRLVHFAVRDYRREFLDQDGEGIVSRLQDAETGDLAFYEAEVKPLVDELSAAADRAVVDMDDATARELAERYLSRWRDFRYEVQRRRADYLAKGGK